MDGITECNDGAQCDEGSIGDVTCSARGLACKEKNKVQDQTYGGSKR